MGDEIQRHDGRRFKLVGVQNGAWVAAAIDCHAPPLTLTARELVTGFDVDDPATPAEIDEAEAWGRLRPSKAAAKPKTGDPTPPPPGSPEAVFQAAQETDDDAG